MAGYNHWIQFEQYVRCEAPVADCLAAASTIVSGETLRPVANPDLPFLSVGPVRKDLLGELKWFDVTTASNVVSAGGGPGLPEVWVDRDKGVLYYRKSD
jgi:hypothetical protein